MEIAKLIHSLDAIHWLRITLYGKEQYKEAQTSWTAEVEG
jgi:hypothetical protein